MLKELFVTLESPGHIPNVNLQALRKNTKPSVGLGDFQIESRTRNLSNAL